LLVFAGIGEALSLYLTYVHYRLRREPGWQSACAISDYVDCDAVVLSPYGSVAGVPLSVLGAWFYAGIALLAVAEVRGSPWRMSRSPAVVIWSAAVVASGVSVILGIVSVGYIGAICVLCAALYVVNLVILITAWLAVRSTNENLRTALKAERAHWRSHPFPGVAALAGALVALLLVRAVYLSSTAGGSDVCGAVAAALRGDAAPSIEVRVFSDYQCPHCKALDRDLRGLRDSGGVRIVQEHYPLDGACNPHVKRTRHVGACVQARAALCAEGQNRGAEFSDRLFDGGASSPTAVADVARSVGLDVRLFEACLHDEDTAARLRQGIGTASNAGVRATPTIFVNGRKHVGRLSPDDLRCLRAAAYPR
jgi:protein-disulfide isomerase/uncharacterized membrane protein